MDRETFDGMADLAEAIVARHEGEKALPAACALVVAGVLEDMPQPKRGIMFAALIDMIWEMMTPEDEHQVRDPVWVGGAPPSEDAECTAATGRLTMLLGQLYAGLMNGTEDITPVINAWFSVHLEVSSQILGPEQAAAHLRAAADGLEDAAAQRDEVRAMDERATHSEGGRA